MDYTALYKKTESFVRELFEKNQSDALVYHNIEHTEKVVERVKEIAANYDLSERDQFILYTAAWFHDTGHLFADPSVHELKSVDLMKDFVSRNIQDDELIK